LCTGISVNQTADGLLWSHFHLAGLIDAYAAACAALASTLQASTAAAQQQQQEHQYGCPQTEAAHSPPLLTWLLCMWETLVLCWPTGSYMAAMALSCSARMAAAAPAFASLAAAMLRSPRIDSRSKTSAVDKAGCLFTCMQQEALERFGFTQQQAVPTSNLAVVSTQLLESEDFVMLQCICTAVCAQHVHASTRGKAGTFASSARYRAAAAAAGNADTAGTVPKHHRRLLRELAIGEDIALLQRFGNKDVVSLIHSICSAIRHVMMFKLHSTDGASSSSVTAAAAA
jgi:hypothetical protein